MLEEGTETSDIARLVVPIEGVNQAVRALWAYNKPAIYKDLAGAANLHPTYMSQSLSASRDVGLSKTVGKKGFYELTDKGLEYARLLTAGKESECRGLLKEIILENPLWREIITFLKMNENKERDPLNLVIEVEKKLGKRWSSSMRGRYAKTYSSILGYAGLVEVTQGRIISKIGLEGISEVKELEELPVQIPSVVSAPAEFAEFRVPDSFILYVRKDLAAIEFMENQLRDNSLIIQWLQFVKSQVISEAQKKKEST